MNIIGGHLTIKYIDKTSIRDITVFDKAGLGIENLDIIIRSNRKSKELRNGTGTKNLCGKG